MTIAYQDSAVQLIKGDVAAVLKTLPDDYVQTVVTSPPYWGLRNYGVEGQLGLEPAPELYVAKMVEVFREIRRVLKDDGTLWINLGDSYAANGISGLSVKGVSSTLDGTANHAHIAIPKIVPNGLKPKDLVGIPWRVAFALQADGWYLRSDIIWSKPNPMPESVADRPTKAHEYIFLLSKSSSYYYDAEAIAEPSGSWNGSTFDGERDLRVRPTTGRRPRIKGDGTSRNDGERWNENNGRGFVTEERRNKRSVWTIATQPYAEAHFATFPEKLIEPCILAGCPIGGMVLDPFAGAGTTLLVAKKLNRVGIGIELNLAYCAMTAARLSSEPARML